MLDNFQSITTNHGLVINPTKLMAFVFGSYQQRLFNNVQINIGNFLVAITLLRICLEVLLDNRLRFSQYIVSCLKAGYGALKNNISGWSVI